MSGSHDAFESFREAMDKDPSLDLEAYLAAHEIQDEELRIRIEDHAWLLGALRMGLGSSSFPDADTEAAKPLPETIAGYRVLRRLGTGGMGTVYLVEEGKSVRRTCALKIIRSGFSNQEILQRFEAERQAISLMEHENIARLYGAGSTTQGQPYFVMEYLDGIPITEYAQVNKLDMEERIALIQSLCNGIQHAHQKGILHRDLKPSNVLVCQRDGQATVKIIDFGLARALDQDRDEALLTLAGQVIGTPGYMSPEQAGALDQELDARTDVYSIGAILYELLCGCPPIAVDRSRPMWLADLQRRLREEDPTKPSSRICTQGDEPRGTPAFPVSVPEWRRRIAGDLDWIILKALDKDPDLRYQWPSELANDLERYLSHRPICAAPPGARRAIRKFLRRNRLRVAVLGAVLLLLLGTMTTALSLQFAQAREVGLQSALLSYGLGQVSEDRFDLAERAFQQLVKEAPQSDYGKAAVLAQAGLLYRIGWPRFASRVLASVESELGELPHDILRGTLPGYAGWAHILENGEQPESRPSWLADYSKASNLEQYSSAAKLARVLSQRRYFEGVPLLATDRAITSLRENSRIRYLAYVGGLESNNRSTLRLCVLNLETGKVREFLTTQRIRYLYFPSTTLENCRVKFLAVYSERNTDSTKPLDSLGYFSLDLGRSAQQHKVKLLEHLLIPHGKFGPTRPGTIVAWRDPTAKQQLRIALRHATNWSYHVLTTPEQGRAVFSSPQSNLHIFSNHSQIGRLLTGHFTNEDNGQLQIFASFGEWGSYTIYLLQQREGSHHFEVLANQEYGCSSQACLLPPSGSFQHDRVVLNTWAVPSNYHDNLFFFGRFRPRGVDRATRLLDFDSGTTEFRVVAQEPSGEMHRLFRNPFDLATGDLDGDGQTEIIQLLAVSLPDKPVTEHAYVKTTPRCLQILHLPEDPSISKTPRRFQTVLMASTSATYMTTANLDADPSLELILSSPSQDADKGTITIHGYQDTP